MKYKVILIFVLSQFLACPLKADNIIKQFIDEYNEINNPKKVAQLLAKKCGKELLATGLMAGGLIAPVIQSIFKRGLPTKKVLGLSALAVAAAPLLLDSLDIKRFQNRKKADDISPMELLNDELAEVIGSEDHLNIPNSDNRNTIPIKKEILELFLKQAKNPQNRPIGLLGIDWICNKLGFPKKQSQEYQEIEDILKKSSHETIELKKKYLPYLMKYLYDVWEIDIVRVGPNFHHIYTNESLTPSEEDSKIVKGEVSSFFYNIRHLDRDILWRKCRVHKAEDGTPLIYRKNEDGTESIDEYWMRVCGLHGIPWKTLKAKNAEDPATSIKVS